MKIKRLRTAAYDNWKPASHSQKGLKHNSRNADAARLLIALVLFPNNSPATKKLNITADRRTEGDAPANKLNSHKPAITPKGFIHFIVVYRPIGFSKVANNQYTNPRCRPEIAIICTTPVLAYD